MTERKHPIRIGINGFGRIGRTLARIIEENQNAVLVGINDLTNADNLAHLLKYDSVHGRFIGTVTSGNGFITINGKNVTVFKEPDPTLIPWGKLDIDFVIEATGRFKSSALAEGHIKAGAKKVIISAPPTDKDTKSIVLGVNDHLLLPTDKIISNASCTTNCAAPMVKILQDNWEIEEAYISTVHSYTSDQKLHDAPHNDWRRGRAAAESIVPTSTGAAKAITKIFPSLDGHIGGAGIRVPVPNGSLTDLTCMVRKKVDSEIVNKVFKEAALGKMKGILEYTEDPIVSRDILGNAHSCIFDAQLTSVLGKMVKVVGWYDNEWGYSSRLLDLIVKSHQLSND